MKKLSVLLIIMIFGVSCIFSQNNAEEIKAIKAKIVKSDEDIKNEKKKLKYQTWDARGKLFLEADQFEVKHLYVGLLAEASSEVEGSVFTNAKLLVGDPDKVETLENGRVKWTYERINLYFEEGKLVNWEVTKIVFENCLDKAYEAFMKAIEVDTKEKYLKKDETKQNLALLRNLYFYKSFDMYSDENLESALFCVEKSIELYEYPKIDVDTLFNIGEANYNAGVFANNAEQYDKSIKFFQESIKHKNKIGFSYKYIYDDYIAKDEETKAVEALQDGAEKFPDEVSIIYALIGHYAPLGEYDKAFIYIDKAISLDKENKLLYVVKGNCYNEIFITLQTEYYKNVNKSDSLFKLSIRERNNPERLKEVLAEQAEIDKQTPIMKKEMNVYFEKGESSFKDAIAVPSDKKSEDVYFSFGEIYYARASIVTSEAQKIPISKRERATEAKEDATKYLTLSMPLYEQAHEINGNEPFYMQRLIAIYAKLGMYDKQNEIKAELEELLLNPKEE